MFYIGFSKLTNFRFMKRSWIFDLEVSCKLFTFFFFANIGVSAQSMALVAVNRFVGVFFPNHAEKFNVKRARIMVTLIWYEAHNWYSFSFMYSYGWNIFTNFCLLHVRLISLGMMLLPLLEVWGRLGYEPKTFSCTILKKNGSSPMPFLLSIGFLCPFAVIAVCYVLIYWQVKSSGKKAQQSVAKARNSLLFQQQIRKCEIQMTRTVLLVSLSYVACFMPGFLLMVVDPMPPCDDFPDLHVAGYIILWCSGQFKKNKCLLIILTMIMLHFL